MKDGKYGFCLMMMSDDIVDNLATTFCNVMTTIEQREDMQFLKPQGSTFINAFCAAAISARREANKELWFNKPEYIQDDDFYKYILDIVERITKYFVEQYKEFAINKQDELTSYDAHRRAIKAVAKYLKTAGLIDMLRHIQEEYANDSTRND